MDTFYSSSGAATPIAATSHTSGVKHYRSLQIMRAAAAWMVVYHHYIQLLGINFTQFAGLYFRMYGSFGVDLFFVLSGFVMFESVRLREQSAREFITRRITRIVPNYWFYTALLLLLCVAAPDAFTFFSPFTAGSVIKSLLFVPHSNPSGLGFYPFLTVGWTLNYEMFFYCLFSVCLLLPRNYSSAIAATLLLVLPTLQQYLPGLFAILGPFGILIPGRYLHEFAIGMLVAGMNARACFRGKWSPYCGVAMLFCSCCFVVYTSWWECAAGLACCAFICLEGLCRGSPSALLEHFGNTSYSTYLCHPLAISAVRAACGVPAGPWQEAWMLILVTVLTIASSEVTYRLIERKAAGGYKRFPRRGLEPRLPN